MPTPKSSVIISLILLGVSLLSVPSTALAAKMTREQARIECRSEVPRTGGGDRGLPTNRIGECIKAKMSKK
jgi:hypothetical protein